MALAMIALATGVSTGLRRIGWELTGPAHALAADHGTFMIAGFLGTLIGLERAVAFGRSWAYAGPLLTGAGGLARIVGAPPIATAGLTLAGSVVVTAALGALVQRRPTLFTATMMVGALCWVLGNLNWVARAEVPEIVTRPNISSQPPSGRSQRAIPQSTVSQCRWSGTLRRRPR